MKQRSRWAPMIVLVTALGVLFHRLLAGEALYWGTPLLQFYPWETAAFAAIRTGSLPLWNPAVGNGAPLLANYQSAVLYPPNWLYLAIPVEYGMGLIAVAHLVWASAGMMAYLRRLGVGMLGQGLGAIAFALSGYLVSRLGFLSIAATVAWLPWLMWAVDGLLTADMWSKAWWKSAALLSATAAMGLLAGHAQTAFYSLVMAVLYTVWRVMSLPRGRRLLQLAAVGGGLALGALVAAAQLLPTAELMLASQRAGGIDREAGLAYSFWPWRLLTLVAPNLFGSPATANFDGRAAYWEDAIYVGLLTLVMAGHGVARWLRERAGGELSDSARVAPFFVFLIPAAFVFALGSFSPVFMWLFDHNVPGFVTFQGPTRWTVLVEFALCTLAAVGVDAWHTSERQLFWTRLLTAGGVSFIVASLLATRYVGGAVRFGFVPAMAWLGGTIIVVGTVSLLLPRVEERPAWRPLWEIAVLVVVAADLVASQSGLNPTLPPGYYHQPSTLADAVRPLTRDARAVYLPDDEYQVKFKTYLDFKDFHAGDQAHWAMMRSSLLPNLGMLDDVPSASNFDPLLAAGQDALVSSLSELTQPDMIEQARRMNVSVILTTQHFAGLKLIAQSGPVIAYQVPDPWPRASVADCSQTPAALTCQPSPSGTAHIVSDEASRVEITTSSDHPAALLLLDTYYPGWSVSVDGSAASIRLANKAFRAVSIPAGRHQVVFSYAPASFLSGAAISGIALIVLGWILVFKAGLLRKGSTVGETEPARSA